MNSNAKPSILSVDDSQDTLRLIERFLGSRGYDVVTADNGMEGLKMVRKVKPDLILLDVRMPGMDGYKICQRLQKDEETAYIPVVFLTALGQEESRARAFSLGAVDYLVKPVKKDTLLKKVSAHVATSKRWQKIRTSPKAPDDSSLLPDFVLFKEFLSQKLDLDPEKQQILSNLTPSNIYELSSRMGTDSSVMAQYVAKFLGLPYTSFINPEHVQLGVLPTPFCKSKRVVALNSGSAKNTFVLSNPFDWDLLDNMRKFKGFDKTSNLIISEPQSIDLLFKSEEAASMEVRTCAEAVGRIGMSAEETKACFPNLGINSHPIVFTANNILEKGVSQRASDIHIEPKEGGKVVRFRIDGDLREAFSLTQETGIKVISRFKVLAHLDIAEKRKPQDGAFSATIDNRQFSVRVATTSTPHGESVIMRLLEPNVKAKELKELGMTDKQARTMTGLVNRPTGLILIVGNTGSGKTTTIYSLLHKTDYVTRSVMSVEDPAEYRISFVNQQQVNEKGGVTFEALLKSAVRQDPDILFMGEVRDPFSAKTAVDFASTGHLTISTLHTSNATTAIFRLERLGLERGMMADTLLAVVAQKLVRRLCSYCRSIVPISEKEVEMLSPFTDEMPKQVAHPVGCEKCAGSGYHGREGVCEILEFDTKISQMVRDDIPISTIRSFARDRGDFMMVDHAMDKVRNFICPPRDVYEMVLVEDITRKRGGQKKSAVKVLEPETEDREDRAVLVVDDDEDTAKLIALILKKQGYWVTTCTDGIDALLQLDKGRFDIVLSDVNMPNLDGFKLVEIMQQRGLMAPVIFLTSRDTAADEKRGLELGAVDYIKKPVKKDKLLLRVKRTLEKQRASRGKMVAEEMRS